MYSRLLIVLILFSVIVAGCAYSPHYDSENSGEKINVNGCYLTEEYNNEDDSCYLNCNNLDDQQCDALTLQVYGGLDEFIDEDLDGYIDPLKEEPDDLLIASYSLDTTLSLSELSNIEPENDEKFQHIWQAILAILPEDYLQKEVVEYHINTDGFDNTLAYVTLHESIPEKWVIAIDSADFTSQKDKEFIHTVIHEFAHIVFLNKSQVDIDSTQSCANYSITEGCSRSASYINTFYTRFWAEIIEDNSSALADVDPTDKDELTEFYKKYRAHFVSEYAASNPIEDAAEIFVHFVLGKKPQNSHLITEQKIEFLYRFPELIELRSKIRANLIKHSDI
ncbi:MAG: hypothetical protein ACI8VW_004136 [bacterium]|jgi:hypothetical protein